MMIPIPQLVNILKQAKTIAVNGLSYTPGKPAHDIPYYLARQGYTVVGINPTLTPRNDEIRVYASLAEVPDEIDILNVFRRSADAEHVVEEAVERHKNRGDISTIWLQSGITTQYGNIRCTDAGITYTDNTCIYVIHKYV